MNYAEFKNRSSSEKAALNADGVTVAYWERQKSGLVKPVTAK
jgi:hypothetical protein